MPKASFVTVFGVLTSLAPISLPAARGQCDITCDAGATSEAESDCGAASNGGDGTDLVNGGCSSNPARFSSLSCGGTRCGTVGVAGGFRDEDWYSFTLTAETGVVATLRAEFNGEFLLRKLGVGPGVCNFPDRIAEASVSPCTDVVLSTCLPAGNYALVVAPDVFSDLACGAEYNLHLSCDTADPDSYCRGACVNTSSCACEDATLQTDCAGADEAFHVATICCDVACVPPGQTYASLNMQLLSHVPLDQFPSDSSGGNDVWGFTSPRGRKYAVIGLTEGTGFVDITYPRNPVVVADIPDTASTWSDMKVYWPYVYNANESGGGVQVIDVSQIDPPTRGVTLVRTFTQSGLQTSHTIALNPDSGFLYLNGSNLGGGRLVAVSLADPANPQLAGQAVDTTYVHDSLVVNYTSGPYAGREIAFCHDGGSGLHILDVTNKSNMFLLSTMTYPTLSYCHQGWLTEDRRYLIIDDEADEASGVVSNTTVYVANVENLTSPFLAATFTYPTGCWIDHDGMVRGNRWYQAQYTAGLRVLDISNPLVPFETAYFDSRPEDNSANFSGMWGSFSDYPTRIVVGSDMERGLFVLCDEPEKPLASFVMNKTTACSAELITFDAGSSTHCSPQRSVVGFEWDFDYDGVTFDVDATGVTVQHGYVQEGVHTIALRVTDDDSPAHSEISTLKIATVTECPPPGNPVWNSDPLSPERTTRSLRFGVEAPVTATGTPPEVAIKVTPVSLQRPDPKNLPQNPPPNFSTYDTLVNGVCAGGTHPGHRCDADIHCPGGACGSLAGCTAAGEMNGCARWVGKPATFLESQDNPGIGSYRAARLQCTPFYLDWVTETASNPIAVVGAEIAPSSEYSVQTYSALCKGVEDTCTEVSLPVTMFTRRSGDVEAPFNPPATSDQPNAVDVTQLVNKFKNVTGALVKATTQLQPNLPELNADLSALDIAAVVDAVKQFAYAFSGPCPCPSQVTCASTPCATPSVCVSTYGAGSLCVKTCTGGSNEGNPCVNNSHCPGATCSNGFCRDRCGRCSP